MKSKRVPKVRVNTDPQGSSHSGLGGLFESLLRRFKTLVHAVVLSPMYALACGCIGLSLVPGVFLVRNIHAKTAALSSLIHYPAVAISVAVAYFLYGFSLILIVPGMNFLFRAKLQPWRGPYYSLGTVKWYIHNALTYLARYTFLEFITPTPFNLFFFKLMGMKIGDGTQINTAHISDPSLIELGSKVTIGGSATIVAHYGVGGFLIISPVVIKSGATIGLRTIVMGGAEVGEGARVLPNSVVLPKTKIPDGETWGGVPAKKIDFKKKKSAA